MDINQRLKENIKEEFKMLPEKTQLVLNNFKFNKVFNEIGKKYYFTEDEIKKLEVETILVLIGLVHINLFSQNIINNMNISEKEMIEIKDEVFKKIFTPIAEKMELLIKDNLSTENISWQQRINFIVSGGDYSVFLDKK
jgi:hypothetical protein